MKWTETLTNSVDNIERRDCLLCVRLSVGPSVCYITRTACRLSHRARCHPWVVPISGIFFLFSALVTGKLILRLINQSAVNTARPCRQSDRPRYTTVARSPPRRFHQRLSESQRPGVFVLGDSLPLHGPHWQLCPRPPLNACIVTS